MGGFVIYGPVKTKNKYAISLGFPRPNISITSRRSYGRGGGVGGRGGIGGVGRRRKGGEEEVGREESGRRRKG